MSSLSPFITAFLLTGIEDRCLKKRPTSVFYGRENLGWQRIGTPHKRLPISVKQMHVPQSCAETLVCLTGTPDNLEVLPYLLQALPVPKHCNVSDSMMRCKEQPHQLGKEEKVPTGWVGVTPPCPPIGEGNHGNGPVIRLIQNDFPRSCQTNPAGGVHQCL